MSVIGRASDLVLTYEYSDIVFASVAQIQLTDQPLFDSLYKRIWISFLRV